MTKSNVNQHYCLESGSGEMGLFRVYVFYDFIAEHVTLADWGYTLT